MYALSATADAASVIAALGLAPHPEGGWYRETWRAPPSAGPDGRSAATAILYLLEAGGRSHWHRVDAAELWLFQAGAPLVLSVTDEPGGVRDVTLGADPLEFEPQALAPAGAWQSAQASDEGWTLVACVVVPGFEFAGFEMAPPGWAPPG